MREALWQNRRTSRPDAEKRFYIFRSLTMSASATMEQSVQTGKYRDNEVTLEVGVPKEDQGFTVCLEADGRVKVACTKWTYGFTIDHENSRIVNDLKKVLANITFLENSSRIDSITILDWERFLTAFRAEIPAILVVDVPKDYHGIVVCLQPNGRVKVTCSKWTDEFPIDDENGWIVNDQSKVLANLAFIENPAVIDSIRILDWRQFLTALDVLHKPTT
jgi:hypothetical protein